MIARFGLPRFSILKFPKSENDENSASWNIFSYQNLGQGKSLHQIPKSFVLREWTNRKYLQEARYRSYGRKDRYHFCQIFKRNIINNEKFRYNLVKLFFIKSFQTDLIIARLDLSNTFSARTNVPSKPKTKILMKLILEFYLWNYYLKNCSWRIRVDRYPESGSESGYGSFNTWTSHITLSNEVWYWSISFEKFN